MPTSNVVIGYQKHLSLQDIVNVAHGARVSISSKTLRVLATRRREIVAHINSNPDPAYGFNRGFGHNVDKAVAPQDLGELQKNLIRSHACGIGELASKEIVRATMLLRAHSLSQGHSGIRPVVVQTLVTFLNKGITPCVPCLGSVGASGDLAPLSHIALALMGEGLVFSSSGRTPIPAKSVLKRLHITPLKLEMKEGLALNNGMQFSTALAVITHDEMQRLIRTAALATAMSAQVMLGSDNPFLAEVHKLRPHKGAQTVSQWIWNLMQNSPMCECHRDFDIDGEVQDPYNLRCAGQVLGACHDLIENAGQILKVEANSVTDNPLLFPDHSKRFTRIVSAGHFHGMPVAVALYNFMQAMGIIARLSNMRCVRYVDEKRNKGLGSDLLWPELQEHTRAASSGMMLAEYASAALTNVIWGASMPSHIFSLSTDAGQEDHVSMAAGLGVRVFDTLPRLAEVLAIELAFATQASAIRKVSESLPSKHQLSAAQTKRLNAACRALQKAAEEVTKDTPFNPSIDIVLRYHWEKKDRELSPPCERAAKIISKIFPIVKKDRALSQQLIALARVVRSGELLEVTPEAKY